MPQAKTISRCTAKSCGADSRITVAQRPQSLPHSRLRSSSGCSEDEGAESLDGGALDCGIGHFASTRNVPSGCGAHFSAACSPRSIPCSETGNSLGGGGSSDALNISASMALIAGSSRFVT